MKKVICVILVCMLALGGVIFNLDGNDKSNVELFVIKAVNDFGSQPLSSGNTYYVTTSGSDINDGTSISNAWRTIGKANQNLQAGDTVYIGGGTYDRINPANSGASGNYITYKNYNSETVYVSGGIPIDLRNTEFIINEG